MGRITSGNTKPEMIVRSLLHSMGYRFRLHGKVNKKINAKGVLAGKPDIVLAKYKTVIFVHGCFWHRHKGCKNATTPKTNTEWWGNKFKKNQDRDIRNQEKLTNEGWNIIVIWECETKNIDSLANKIKRILNAK